jgi:hypothetical protein
MICKDFVGGLSFGSDIFTTPQLMLLAPRVSPYNDVSSTRVGKAIIVLPFLDSR